MLTLAHRIEIYSSEMMTANAA